MKLRRLRRRDLVWLLAKRAEKLNTEEAAAAWKALARELWDISDVERGMPVFRDVVGAIRKATIAGKNFEPVRNTQGAAH